MKKLSYLRQQKGLSQQKLGDAIGLERNTICQYESGKRIPAVDTLIKLAQFFNVTTDYLLDLSNLPHGDNATYEIELAPEAEDERRVLDLYRTIKEKGGNESAIKFIDLLSELLLKKGE